MMTVERCSECLNIVGLSDSTHVKVGTDRMVCGWTGKFARVVEEQQRTDADRLLAARRELETVMGIITDHIRTEGGPPEVRSEAGWIDLTDLLQPLEAALS